MFPCFDAGNVVTVMLVITYLLIALVNRLGLSKVRMSKDAVSETTQRLTEAMELAKAGMPLEPEHLELASSLALLAALAKQQANGSGVKKKDLTAPLGGVEI